MADAPDSKSGGKPWGFESLHQHHVGAKFGFAPIFFYRNKVIDSFVNNEQIAAHEISFAALLCSKTE